MRVARRAVRGIVESFDPEAGMGEVRFEEESSKLLPFHCTQIADGTRTITAGAAVVFDVAPTNLGRWEARSITRLQEDLAD